jgi:small conductance mechanosensitive channel
MNEWWREHSPLVVEYGAHVIGAILIIAFAWIGNRFFMPPLRRVLGRSRIDPSAASFLANLARTIFFLVIILAVLQQLGIQTASLLTLLGAAGIAVALSLQGSLANFASGILVLAFRMVRVGDWIEIGDVRGKVTELLPLHAVLVTQDNQRITLPKTLLTTGPVRNHSAMPIRRVQWTLPLTVDDDLTRVKAALQARLIQDKRVLPDPAPEVYLQEWSSERRVLQVTAWAATADYLPVQQQMLEPLGLSLEEIRRAKETTAPSSPHEAG